MEGPFNHATDKTHTIKIYGSSYSTVIVQYIDQVGIKSIANGTCIMIKSLTLPYLSCVNVNEKHAVQWSEFKLHGPFNKTEAL